MAKAKRSISKNSSTPESAPTPTSPTPTGAPDALTLDEVLEQMLPHCDDDPLEVAEWLEARTRKKAGVRLLADGIAVAPHLCKTHLAVVAKNASDGRATLEVQVHRNFGHVEKTETIVGRKIPKKGFDIFDVEKYKKLKPIKQSSENVRPIERWTVERKSFETNREQQKLKLVTNPRGAGAKPKFQYEFILIEAAVYVVTNGLPPTLEELVHALQLEHGDKMPRDTQGKDILRHFFDRVKQAEKFDRELILTEAAVHVVTNGLPSTPEELVRALQPTLGGKMPKDTQGKGILGPFFSRMKQALDR
jgi:hypothetical protein